MMLKKLLTSVFVLAATSFIFTHESNAAHRSLGTTASHLISNNRTNYLQIQVEHPCIQELLQSNGFKRLTKIQQYGLDQRLGLFPESYTRAEHSLRVYEILRRNGASLKEQIAGLLHDASHTAFSHLGCFVFGFNNPEKSYQDEQHSLILEKTDIAQILQKHGFTPTDIDPLKNSFEMLEQRSPALCADRIEYITTGAILEGFINSDQANTILDHIHWDTEHKRWYFDDNRYALLIGYSSLYHTQHVWGGSPLGKYYNEKGSDLLKTALKQGLMSPDTFIYGTDQSVWRLLHQLARKHPEINQKLTALKNPSTKDIENQPSTITVKFRGVDPWVKNKETGSFERLTQLVSAYGILFKEVQKWCENPVNHPDTDQFFKAIGLEWITLPA